MNHMCTHFSMASSGRSQPLAIITDLLHMYIAARLGITIYGHAVYRGDSINWTLPIPVY